MKRFFKPVEKDGPSKKPAPSQSCDDGGATGDEKKRRKDPLKFVTWNANSLLLRVKNNWPEFAKFVSDLDPDVIAIQEVRMPAAGSKGAPKNPGELKDDTSSSREEKKILMRALSSPPFGNYCVWWSLGDFKYAGTALLVKKCFQPKVSFLLDSKASKHEPDGRVILAEFETFRLLNTYSPNNGWRDEENSFQRRRKWDKKLLEFVVKSLDKPLIWCGDLNVSHEEVDVSHPDFFSAAKQNGYVPPNAEDCGQPGFTLAERKRFGAIVKEGKLIDAYRYLHKDKDMECGFSWSGNPIGKYRGKRMRIDYFIVSEKFKDRIRSCEMHGRGIELEVNISAASASC
ncbi:DNA-(apurinic or apyrimidinic site) endonuclease isoform X2 [Syzygium oleosum]|uniref:DNA-(apurinic or apyrimidinic site) endonuclease isoform X2 n=1 Tax=Syzygium oleosum TaxID=219896 RepID=UPI0024B8A31B|nr:DNA-(apurinic or apyrimidinic site) endonuclease isoform X2 [Syzygium oleosum]